MYHLRLKIFIVLCVCGLFIPVGRLLMLQTAQVDQARRELARLRVMPPQQRPTIRGKIVDRNGSVLALDRPAFYLQISYHLTRHMDPRWREGRIRRALNQKETREQTEQRLTESWQPSVDELRRAIQLANTLADVSTEEIIDEINQINDRIWEMASFVHWRRRNPNASMAQYRAQKDQLTPERVVTVDLYEMHRKYPLVELKSQNDLLRAQVELLNLPSLDIQAQSKRYYPYGASASHIIGWVAPGQVSETELFEQDDYLRYLDGEVLGKAGIEWIYEPVLRGRRGEVTRDRLGNVLARKEPEYGKDVRLTIDIELQHKIELLLADPEQAHGGKKSAAVVLDAKTNDILAMASVPVFDLNAVRQTYMRLLGDPELPLTNRAIQTHYPPGSTAKPIVLMAGLEERKITREEIISCGWSPPPSGWPRCLLQRVHGSCHDARWAAEGGNNAKNAMRGSCNIYFSRLADRLSSEALQAWFWKFGFGQNVLVTPLPQEVASRLELNRQLPQSCGSLIFGIQREPADDPSQLPALPPYERKWWGIGQGNLRVTVLQTANALSAFVRGDTYKTPRLVHLDEDPANNAFRRPINLSARTSAALREGLAAVVNEPGGTAYNEFRHSDLLKRDMKIYGKTGSTERPYHAWWESFAEDKSGRAVVVVVLVEGGEGGSSEAAPLGHRILRFCNEAGYIGTQPVTAAQ